MAFTYSANLQNRIALSVWGVQNSGLDAEQKIHLDGTWTSGSLTTGRAYDAFVELGQIGQWFEQAAATPDTSFPQVWESLFVARVSMLLSETVRPERYATYAAEYERCLDQLLDQYSKVLATAEPATSSQTISLANIRYFVIDHCIRRREPVPAQGLRRRLFPPVNSIDSHLQWVLNWIWNKATWNFRKRQVTMVVNHLALTDATWTESTKTLTKASGFTDYTHVAGARILISDGTGVIPGEYVITSRTSANAIVLESSLSLAAGDLATGDIDGALCWVTFRGLAANETFDSVASRKWFFSGESASGGELIWTEPTQAAAIAARYGETQGIPVCYRTEPRGQAVTWLLYPFPDDDYTLRGAVYVAGPGAFTSLATATTALERFPVEFGTAIRDMVLARVLKSYATSDASSFWSHAVEQVESLLPVYAETGQAAKQYQAQTNDVYQDYNCLNDDGSGSFLQMR
jgi:hypothetical protein